MPEVTITLRTIDESSKTTKKVKEEYKGLTPGIDSARKSVTDFLSANAALVGTLSAVGSALAWSVKQAADAQKVDAQLAAVLQSTNHAAGLSAESLDTLATNMSRMSTFEDEAIKSSEALLLTFTSIGKDVFPQAQQTILDMATAMGTDLQSATIQVGKALQDPILGVSALRRVGVNFNEDQQKLIKTMVETGDVMGAQQYILKELSTEFGGSAAAAANTYEGQMTQLKNEIGNVGEAIGTELLPELLAMTKDVKDAAIWVSENMETIKKWGNIIMWVTQPLLQLGKLIGTWAHGLRDSKDAVDEQSSSFDRGAAMTEFYRKQMEQLPTATEEAAAAIQEMSKEYKAYLDLIGTISDENADYNKTMADLQDKYDDETKKLADLTKTRWWDVAAIEEQKGKLTDLQAKMAEETADFEDNSKRRILAMLEERLSADGLTEAETQYLEDLGIKWGIYTEEAVKQAQAARAEVEALTATFNLLPSKKYIELNIQATGNFRDAIAAAQSSNPNRTYDLGTGRAGGGSVAGGMMYPVNERGMPELLNMGNGQFLMMPPGSSGTVIPMQPAQNNQSAGGSGEMSYLQMQRLADIFTRASIAAWQKAGLRK